MKKICIIGIDTFGKHILEILIKMDTDLIIIDRNKNIIQDYKDRVSASYIIDVTNFESVKKVIPKGLDIAIVDLGKNIESSILVTSHLKKLGIPQIVVRAESDQHGSILDMIGATKVIYPNREAAKRSVPLLLSELILNYIEINNEIIITEIILPGSYDGKNALELDLRNKYGINIIAVKNKNEEEYRFYNAKDRFKNGDTAIIAGSESNIMKILNISERKLKKEIFFSIKSFFSFFRSKNKNI